MTADDIKKQKAELIVEYDDAQELVASIEVKTQRIAGEIIEFGETYFKAAGTMFDRDYSEARTRKLFDVDLLLELSGELRAARKKLSALRKQKDALGLK